MQQSLAVTKDSLQYIDMLNRLGFIYYEKNPDSTLYYTDIARNLSQRHNYKKGIADALNNIGVIYLLKGNYQLSLRYYNESLEVYRQLKDSSNITQLLMNIGLTFFSKEEKSNAYRYIQDAFATGRNLRHDSIMALVNLNYLMMFPDSANSEKAQHLLRQAEQIAIKYHDRRIQVQCLNVEAVLEIHNHRYEEGIALLKKSAVESESLEIFYTSMDIYVQLGDLLYERDTAQALRYYEHAFELARNTGYHEYAKTLSKKLYDHYLANNDLQNIKKYSILLTRSYELEDSLNASTGLNYIDYALKDKEIESFKAISSVRRNTIIILSIFSVVTLLLLAYALRSFFAKKKLARALMDLNQKVTAQNLTLQNNNEFNNKIVSILAHDFRQPLASMKNIAMILREYDNLSKQDLNEIIGSIENTSNTSLEIFENILQWIKRQLSGFNYQPEALPLKELLDQSITSYSSLIKEYNIKVHNQVDDQLLLQGEKEMVQFINRNFLHNAIKFSPAGGNIYLHATLTSTEMMVSVTDEGKGMPSEKLQSLFNFKTEQRYDNDREKGAGVALMICKDFAEKMNGRIWATSEPGKGSTFSYALPVPSSSNR